MSHDLLSEYDRLQERLRNAKDKTASAKARYDEALADERSIERQLVETRKALEAALQAPSGRATEVSPSPSGAPASSDSTATPPPPPGIQPSLWELVLAIPRDGDVGMDDLREKFPLSDGAINTRITKAKRAGLVESGGWGRYKLTAQGRKLQGQRLKVVNGG